MEDAKHNVWAYITNEKGQKIGTRDYFGRDVSLPEALELLEEEDGATNIVVTPSEKQGGRAGQPVTRIVANVLVGKQVERVTFILVKPKGARKSKGGTR